MTTKRLLHGVLALCVIGSALVIAEETNPTQQTTSPAAAKIRPTLVPLPIKPDLIIQNIQMKVRRVEDGPGGKIEYFGAYVTVQNNTTAAAGPFDVLLERSETSSNGPWMACGACKIHVAGLAGKAHLTLEPREFNKHKTELHFFRATADVDNTVHESNEGNNVTTRSYPSPPTHR